MVVLEEDLLLPSAPPPVFLSVLALVDEMSEEEDEETEDESELKPRLSEAGTGKIAEDCLWSVAATSFFLCVFRLDFERLGGFDDFVDFLG